MSNPSLRQLAYEQIHAAIMQGTFAKGTVTSEGELSRKLDMSRTPVRAALQQLELEGYIRIASKHGIIILDSSSRRTGDLLEMIMSMVLFSLSASSSSKGEQMLELIASKSVEFNQILLADHKDTKVFTDFELNLLHSIISLRNNDEMARTFRSAANRLFWHQNGRRWESPFTVDTRNSVTRLIDSLSANLESSTEALLEYLNVLKRTWL